MNKKLKYISSSKDGERGDFNIPNERHKRSRFSTKSKIIIWFFTLLSLGVLGFAVFTLFSGAELKVYPRVTSVNVDGVFSAVYAEGSGDIYYETISVNEIADEKIEAEGEKEVESKASGTIIVFNNHSKSSQKLIDNTRFKAPNGLIYRIKDAVTVPGQILEDGNLMPGKIEVKVYADEPGSDYNIEDPVKFTIPGLKGTNLYDGFYARNKTEISGGDVGVRPIVEESQKQEVVLKIKEELKDKLMEKIDFQIPENYIFYEGTERVSFEVPPVETTEDGEARVVVNATLSTALFSESEFAKMIADEYLEDYEDGDVLLKDSSKLQFELEDSQSYDPDSRNSFEFKIIGPASIVWQIDENDLGKKIAGRSKITLNEVLSKFKGVKRAQAVISPFWRQNFPQNPEDIKIDIVEE